MGSQAWSALSVIVSFRNCSWPGVVLSRPLSSYDGNLLIGSVWWLVQGLLGMLVVHIWPLLVGFGMYGVAQLRHRRGMACNLDNSCKW